MSWRERQKRKIFFGKKYEKLHYSRFSTFGKLLIFHAQISFLRADVDIERKNIKQGNIFRYVIHNKSVIVQSCSGEMSVT